MSDFPLKAFIRFENETEEVEILKKLPTKDKGIYDYRFKFKNGDQRTLRTGKFMFLEDYEKYLKSIEEVNLSEEFPP